MTRSEDRLLRHVLAVVCGWEFIALTTRRIPTVSACVWRAGENRRARFALIGVWLIAAAYLTDHFFSAD